MMGTRRLTASLFWALVAGLCAAALVTCAAGMTVAPKVGTVMERKLVKDNPTARGIVNQHKKYNTDQATVKTFENPTLAYVTPWYLPSISPPPQATAP
jgi:hypothetical protein